MNSFDVDDGLQGMADAILILAPLHPGIAPIRCHRANLSLFMGWDA